MEAKMKKLVRSLFSPKTKPISSPSDSIPPNTHLFFRQCPHTTPPTPRPGKIPPVLQIELLGQSKKDQFQLQGQGQGQVLGVPNGKSTPPAADSDIRQYLTAPPRCLDCTLDLAREKQRTIHEVIGNDIAGCRARIFELTAQLATSTVIDSETAEMLNKEIATQQLRLAEHIQTRHREVRAVWDNVKTEWEGAARGVVRGDGSGEGEERCHFEFEPVPQGPLGVRDGEAEVESEAEESWRVLVIWTPLEEGS
ncbi:uncharacterized protein Z518_04868 [Rhinocladiella mackenziei CBS 650.93]|uniref:Uncharacterized protein n=1 Tax=Rhinocladiella mackenziei CBS 650.93 TaxID=1442369 RepID=A0A0D2FX26_9EURO|nr:uncharacterized protein Z518_04868 [Rhinocladiella mackenziei CBS 650.93]KIX06892.1 hypothetical protein Z518_04868 [Rhinocladiella mackenziei CBS 650.93]